MEDLLDYDSEALHYDASRGGEPRAQAAADAVERLLPTGRCTVLDIACGTGIVTKHLLRRDRTVLGVDRSLGMLGLAARRLPGGVMQGDGSRLPLASGSVDTVMIVWLLHLLADPERVLAETVRVLKPGGTLITTVDKDNGRFIPDSDVAEVTAQARHQYAGRASDDSGWVLEWAAEHGLSLAGETRFTGVGQGRTPRRWQEAIRAGHIPWAGPDQVSGLCDGLAALPNQDTARPDPIYRVFALKR